MKKMFGLLAMVIAANVGAVEYSGNPDRFPSLGLSYHGGQESGDFTASAGSVSASQSLNIRGGAFIADMRIPIADNLTVNGAASFSSTFSSASETSILNAGKSKTSGFGGEVGIRLYLK